MSKRSESRGCFPSVTGLQWIVDAYTVVLASLLLLGGSTGDRFGRRTMFQAGLILFAIGSAACSVAPGLGALIAFRMLQAAGGAMLQPNALSTITNVITDPAGRARAIGVWAGVFGVAAASGPILGGILVAAIGWRSVFWVNLPVATAAFMLVARYAPETKAPHPRRVDLPGQALLIITLAAVTFATIEGPVRGWASTPITCGYALAACGLAAFVAVEHRRREPLLELRFFRSPPFCGAATIATLAFAILAGFLFLNTLYLQEIRGESAVSGMPKSQAGVASAIATSSRQLGNVLGVAVIGSVAVGSLAASVGTSGHLRRAAFIAASHTGWDIATACGLAIAILAYLTTGARATAAAVMTEP